MRLLRLLHLPQAMEMSRRPQILPPRSASMRPPSRLVILLTVSLAHFFALCLIFWQVPHLVGAFPCFLIKLAPFLQALEAAAKTQGKTLDQFLADAAKQPVSK